MAIWGVMLGFLAILYATTAIIESWQMTELAAERQRATATAMAHLKGATDKAQAEQLVGAIEAINAKQAEFSVNHWQNKILLMLLTLYIVGQIVVMEYRLLIRPIVRMAALLQSGRQTPKTLAQYARRRDEIGAFAQALTAHFMLVRKEQEAATAEQANLSGRLESQEQFRRESLCFQGRIGEIVRSLEGHATRMSAASENLSTISSEADVRAGASAESTQRVSSHIDVVANSIEDIAVTLASAAAEAQRASSVAAVARDAAEAAKGDAKSLTEAARTIEQVIALIEDVPAAAVARVLCLHAAGAGGAAYRRGYPGLYDRSSTRRELIAPRYRAVCGFSPIFVSVPLISRAMLARCMTHSRIVSARKTSATGMSPVHHSRNAGVRALATSPASDE